MKKPIEFGKFGALCPTAEFLGLPVKKVRQLRDMGLIRLPGGRTRPEDMSEDWMNHAHRLVEDQLATSPAGRARTWRPAWLKAPPAPPRAMAPIGGNYDTWLAAQGGQVTTIADGMRNTRGGRRHSAINGKTL